PDDRPTQIAGARRRRRLRRRRVSAMARWNVVRDHQPGTPPAVRTARGRIGSRHGRSSLRKDLPMPPQSTLTTLSGPVPARSSPVAPVGLSIVIPLYRGAATIRTLV